MKLTKYDKDLFVTSVMNDVPKIDYDAQTSSLCMAWAVARLPAEVALVYKKFPGWVENKHITTPNHLNTVWVPMLQSVYNTKEAHPDLWVAMVPLAEAAKAQYEARKELEDQVNALISGCSTLKQAKDRLPEFEKYLPDDRDGTTTANVPVTANLVTALMSAGWPKGKEAANSEPLVEAA